MLHIKVWDTAGQEKFRTLTHGFYQNGQGIMIVYDVTSAQSFEKVKSWMESIYEHADKDVCKILVGNKIDMAAERVVSFKEGQSCAKEFDMEYVETSAKTGEGLELAFETLIMQVYNARFNKSTGRETSFVLRPNTHVQQVTAEETKSKCC